MKVPIEDFNVRESNFCAGEINYRVVDLHELAKDLEKFEMPLVGIDLNVQPWGEPNINSFCYHIKRIEKCNYEYPIILTPSGSICDGWHRVVKAIIEGRETITAVRLLVMPDCI
jgi:hypothetical protein